MYFLPLNVVLPGSVVRGFVRGSDCVAVSAAVETGCRSDSAAGWGGALPARWSRHGWLHCCLHPNATKDVTDATTDVLGLVRVYLYEAEERGSATVVAMDCLLASDVPRLSRGANRCSSVDCRDWDGCPILVAKNRIDWLGVRVPRQPGVRG
jgi:hypothetical protein